MTFSDVSFAGETDFRETKFDGLAAFAGSEFEKDASFGNALFGGEAVFPRSLFKGDVDFDFAHFSKQVTFQGALFSRDSSFTRAQFDDSAVFRDAQFRGNASFAVTRFDSESFFGSAEFLGNCTFGLASFAGISEFTKINFSGMAIFLGAKFSDNTYFTDTRFDRDFVLQGSRIYSMQLDNVTFGRQSRLDLKDADFSRFIARWDAIRDHLEFNGAAYLALVKSYKNLEWFDDADDCYFQYRRISQDLEPWGWTKLSDIISWLSCGYGVRVSYTVFWCLFTILLFGLIFWAGKGMSKFEIEGVELPGNPFLRPGQRGSLTDALYFSIAMFTTSQAPVNTYPVGFYRHLAMLEGILGWFFLGLFVVVLSGVLIR